MGCANSQPLVDQPPPASASTNYAVEAVVKELVEPRSASPSGQAVAFAHELSKLVVDATSSNKTKDGWAFLVRCAELICATFGLRQCSFVVYTPSGQFCKLACSSGCVLQELAAAHPDLLPAEALGWLSGVADTRQQLVLRAGQETWEALARESGRPDFALLAGPRGGCSALAVLPLPGGLSGGGGGGGGCEGGGEGSGGGCTGGSSAGGGSARCPGLLVLGHTAPLEGLVRESWLATLLPLLSLYAADCGLLRPLAAVERVVAAGSLGALALAVTQMGQPVFEWLHPEDVEARLVVLSPEGNTATVYCRVPPGGAGALGASAGGSQGDGPHQPARATATSSPGQSGPAGQQGQRAGGGADEPGLLGSHMSLDITLTKRCLSGRQRLLFVADVMQALKLYGEPWKDIFFDDATVLTPCWVLAAPLVHEGVKLGAVLWLSSTRVNPEVLMRAASAGASPVIHAIARATARYRANGSGEPSGRCDPCPCPNANPDGSGLAPPPPLLPPPPPFPPLPPLTHESGAGGGGDPGAGGVGGDRSSLACSRGSGVSHAGGVGGSGGGGGAGGGGGTGTARVPATPAPPAVHRWNLVASQGQSEAQAERGGGGGGGGGVGPVVAGAGALQASLVPDVPIMYVLRHTPSTSALMRLYTSNIAQRAPPGDEDRLAVSAHEVRILAKAGEGAFGSVYVGRWRGLVVAVKIIKDTSGSRSLKTAWELAVNKSLSHPAIVTVHAILTDVYLQKSSSRVLRFVPASALEAQQAAAAAASGAGSGGAALPHLPLPPQPGGATATAASATCGPTGTCARAGSSSGATNAGPAQATAGTGADGGAGGAAAATSAAAGLSGTHTSGTGTGTGTATLGDSLGGGGAGGAGGASLLPKVSWPAALAAAVAGGGGGSNSVPTPVPSGGGPLPYLTRLSAGSLGPTPGTSAAVAAGALRPQPAAPKVHAILMEYCNLGGLHKYIDNRMFFRDRDRDTDRIQAAQQSPQAEAAAAAESGGGGGAPAAGPGPPLPPESLHMDFILASLSEVASALQYLHAQGFVHCDLKPENVLLKEATNRRGFTAKLADFGLSELRSADGLVVGDLGGTVTHVAPESVRHRRVSAASDMYAFGVLMWELYTGQQPYRSLLSHISRREERHRALLTRVVHEGLRPTFPPGVPPDYLALATQCWSADPAARPTTAEALAALEAMYARFAPPSAAPA